MAGVQAAARELRMDVEGERYEKACETFTAAARAASAATSSEGCPGLLARAKPFLLAQLARTFNSIRRDGQITGDTVLSGGIEPGRVMARYEGGRWRFENDVW